MPVSPRSPGGSPRQRPARVGREAQPRRGEIAGAGSAQRSKALRVNRQGVGFLGWWYSTAAYHDVAFMGSYTHQHWCGNNTSTPQNQWCDMWLNGF
jgi:hypothetical protein